MKLPFGRPAPPRPQAAQTHIAYDAFSMIIDGKRTVIRSGAFHYFRLPSPDLWQDRLLKIKRAGYNTADLYFHWGFHSPAEDVYDFSGIRDVDRLLTLCDGLGLYVIARPGPYICSEVDGGGHPAWLLAKRDVPLRCLRDGKYLESPEYKAYAQQWYEQIVPRIIKHPSVILFQIENEYANDDMNPGLMRFLYDLARKLGVTVPIIHNDLWKAGCWADLVDIYGVDDYAVSRFGEDWRQENAGLTSLDSLAEVKAQFCTKSPLAVYELQGGWFDSYDGVGYDEMRRRLGRENLELVTWTALAQGATIYSHYMFAGGSNWDHIGAPCVHSSYDFAAPIYEWGGISDRYQAAKAIASVVAAFEDIFAQSEPTDDVQADNSSLLYKARCQGDTRIAFLRNLSAEPKTTTLRSGNAETGPITVAPWSMRVAFLNLAFAEGRVTSSCNLLTAMHRDNQHLLVFHGPGQVTWAMPAPCRLLRDELGASCQGNRVSIMYNGQGWKDVVFTCGGHRYRSLFLPNADEAWLADNYLVVGAAYVGRGRMKGGVVDLPRYEMAVQTSGQKEKTIRIYAVGHLNRAEINDEMILASYDSLAGYLRFDMPPTPPVTLPSLGPWHVASALDQDDGAWRAVSSDAPLDMDSLGIYRGFAWYKATFDGTMESIGLAIRHNAAVYLNGVFVTKLDNYQSERTDTEPESDDVSLEQVALPAGLQRDGQNTLTILVESLGHNKGFLENARFPRGVLAVQADRPLAWSVRAGVAGEADVPQPDFDDSAWAQVADLGQTIASDLLWVRTRFTLDPPERVYAPVGLRLEGIADKAHVYLNGVLLARDWSICPQRHVYLPEGVLKVHGENILTLLLWRRGRLPAAGTIELQPYTAWASNHVNIL